MSLVFYDLMRGYCPRCKEYRSDDGMDAWAIKWVEGSPLCERCGSYVNTWSDEDKEEIEEKKNKEKS
jgi:hypothetical protein